MLALSFCCVVLFAVEWHIWGVVILGALGVVELLYRKKVNQMGLLWLEFHVGLLLPCLVTENVEA